MDWGKGTKVPHFIQSATNQETLWLAGLFSEWNDLRTCTITTREANETVSAVHHRMPVILDTAEEDEWLTGHEGPNIGGASQLRHHPVGRFGIADVGAGLIELLD
ncbi:SOS response-associated peptidase family protein [Falsihalocynthiibacter sp. BN13B15]|uniref:SOS response-associated peptidase family protein n=1 Tax=Falsihalocynthiibacter sp. BN13B15 TaxID=3240871 RepID=UPI00350F8B0A